MSNDSKAENIAFFIIDSCIIAVYHFRSHIADSSTSFEVLGMALLLKINRKSKIYDFQTESMYVNDDILRLDVSMYDFVMVAFFNSHQNVAKD